MSNTDPTEICLDARFYACQNITLTVNIGSIVCFITLLAWSVERLLLLSCLWCSVLYYVWAIIIVKKLCWPSIKWCFLLFLGIISCVYTSCNWPQAGSGLTYLLSDNYFVSLNLFEGIIQMSLNDRSRYVDCLANGIIILLILMKQPLIKIIHFFLLTSFSSHFGINTLLFNLVSIVSFLKRAWS